MDGANATLWISGGGGAAALGLYLLMRAAAGNNAAVRWVGWSLYVLGGSILGRTVLQSTGSYWSLLLFCVLSAAALICVTVTAVHVSDGPLQDSSDTQHGWTPLTVATNWFLGSAGAVVAILVAHGNYWTSGAVVTAIVCLALTECRRQNIAMLQASESNVTQDSFREPALTCLMWGLLTSGLLTAVQQLRMATAVESAGAQTGQFNNVIVLACGMLSLGVLQVVARRRFRNRLYGAITLLMSTVLVCSAGSERPQTEMLCLVVLACGMVSIGILMSAIRPQSTAIAAGIQTSRGDL